MARKPLSTKTRTKPPGVKLAEVAVMAALPNTLTYQVPDTIEVQPGQRVQVPLGTRKAVGIVVGEGGALPPHVEVRPILRTLDSGPVLTAELLSLGLWIADYYVAPIGEVFRAMLPLRAPTRHAQVVRLSESGSRRAAESGAEASENNEEVRELLAYLSARGSASLEGLRRKFPDGLLSALEKKWVAVDRVERERTQRAVYSVRLTGPLSEGHPRLSPVAKRIVEVLAAQQSAEDHRTLLTAARASLPALKKLSAAGVVELTESANYGSPLISIPGQGPPLTLTSAQSQVLDSLTQHLKSRSFQTVLLQGITGSGKTEVYLRLIARCIDEGRTALVLVPEIALTPAVQVQFLARFGSQVALLHSALAENERHQEWWRIRRGEARVVLGTRSAVFAPVADLGVVVVDEEHDGSYKQDETPRYNGRDVAVVRARLAGALAVLGSATPSLESSWNAQQGKYHLAVLPERVGGRKLAVVEIIDMRQEFRETHTQIPISRRLKQEIDAQLASGQQTMILLNRRGYSWFLLCRSCGETQRCVNCSISLTYHRREHRLICHYCGYSAPVPSRCPACGSEYLYYIGEGTEKLESKFAELFPGARVARLDRDVARRPGQFQRILNDFRERKTDLLVGTQLISKGHDFPGVTLVGVVSADLALGLPDFRAAERTFQLLTQAAGRAGRGELPGRVLVQTFYPEHYAIRLAADQNYDVFFQREMRFRRMMHYPPVTALANIIAQGPKLEQAAATAKQVGEFLVPLESHTEGLKVLGPTPAPLAKIQGRFRIQFIVKCTSRARLNAILRQLSARAHEQGIPPRSLMIDVDPLSIM